MRSLRAPVCGRGFRASSALRAPKDVTRGFIRIRCERGEGIGRQPGFAEETSRAIRLLDERWNGCGFAEGWERFITTAGNRRPY